MDGTTDTTDTTDPMDPIDAIDAIDAIFPTHRCPLDRGSAPGTAPCLKQPPRIVRSKPCDDCKDDMFLSGHRACYCSGNE